MSRRGVRPGDHTRHGKVLGIEDAMGWFGADHLDCLAIHWTRGTKSGVAKVKPGSERFVYRPKANRGGS